MDLLNQLDDKNQSPLYLALQHQNFKKARFLIELKPYQSVLNARTVGENRTLLHAVAHHHEEVPDLVSELLKLGTSSFIPQLPLNTGVPTSDILHYMGENSATLLVKHQVFSLRWMKFNIQGASISDSTNCPSVDFGVKRN